MTVEREYFLCLDENVGEQLFRIEFNIHPEIPDNRCGHPDNWEEGSAGFAGVEKIKVKIGKYFVECEQEIPEDILEGFCSQVYSEVMRSTIGSESFDSDLFDVE